MTTQSAIPNTQQYPAAPWSLQGRALVSVQTVDVAAMREFLPAALDVIQIFPGKTLGGVYLSSYEEGSVLTYNELIVFCGLTRYGDRIGPWVTHIYVDNPRSVAGGREIWGLPKEMASFRWTAGENPQVAVYQDDQLLCRLKYHSQFPGVPVSLPPFLGAFSLLHSNFVWFKAQGRAKTHLLMGAEVEVPSDSPFAPLKLNHPLMAFNLEDFAISIDQPRVQHLS
ncbi:MULTISPECIES: acetoacetate decarboxylase family protein [unclassified Leptolyngbya]|uniref:acetoacetate decarboxylase family protein n=1 Tax=unclassified Leptolyngbya TaxID=2650499 RepID=UPI0016825918|nr:MULTISPECIES: acetoacetate decarboxylase family protein [unclassified Leptolyngbya]MBD1911641.1 acetoacetate decarboxylase family protein [Leptolyngbya sp. FACHB-8]MBD2157839.1 acetoacetate decarboxylase family protein [Leptolyngbya sp. FACHB-16]